MSTVLTIKTVSPSVAALGPPSSGFHPGGGTALAFVGGFLLLWKRKRLPGKVGLLLLIAAIGLLPVSGCGGLNGKNFFTPLGVSNVTVTATNSATTTYVTTFVRVAVTQK